MPDALLLYVCLLGAAWIVLALLAWRRHRRFKVLLWAAAQLRHFREGLQARRKTLLQLEAWHPGDAKAVFMREYLNQQIKMHNRIVDRINEEARKP